MTIGEGKRNNQKRLESAAVATVGTRHSTHRNNLTSGAMYRRDPVPPVNSWTCARVLCQDEGATLADIREAVTMLEDAARTCRRVLGGAHPTTEGVEDSLREAQTALHSSEAPPSETDTP